MPRRVVLFSTAPKARRLAAALESAGAAALFPPAEGARVVFADSFSESGLAAAARLCAAAEAEIIAAEVPQHCHFPELLLARARQHWRRPVALPELRGTEDFTAAAKKIIAALPAESAESAESPPAAPPAVQNTESPPPENNKETTGIKETIGATGILLKQITDSAAAARAGDHMRARELLPAADIPAARALSLLLEIQECEDSEKRGRTAALLRRETLNLTEEEKNATGAPAFLAAFEARRALGDVL